MGPSQHQGRRRADRTVLARLRRKLLILAASVLAFPASADTAINSAVEAAILSCSNSPDSVLSRLQMLSSAGFKVASDNQISRELRYMRSYYPGAPRGTAEGKLKGFIAARTFPERDQPFAFGSSLDAEGTLRLLETGQEVSVVLEALDVPVSLDLSIGPAKRTLTSDFAIGCHLTLPDPFPETFLASLIPNEARVYRQNSHANGASQVREFDIAGRTTFIELIDMTRDADIMAVPELAGSGVRVAGLLRMTVRPIVLDDSKPHFRKVTP
jgi:hypothetical protein